MDRTTDRDTAPPPTATPRPALRRPREGRILTGVAAGIADHVGIDVVIVRILIVVFVVLTEGVGVLAYIASAIFIPAAEEPGPPHSSPPRGGEATRERDPLFWAGVGVLVVGALWLARGAASGVAFFPGGGGFSELVVPLVLIAFGLAIWRAGDRREVGTESQVAGTPPPPSPHPRAGRDPSSSSTQNTEPPMTTGQTGTPTQPTTWPTAGDETLPTCAYRDDANRNDAYADDAYRDGAYRDGAYRDDPWPPAAGAGGNPPPPPPTGQPYGQPAWTPPPEPEPRPRSLLNRLTLGVALVVLGLLWTLRVADVLAIGWGTILAGSLLVIGVGLLIGSVVGNARWLILVGALVTPVVLLAQLGPLPYLADGWNIDSNSAGDIRSTPADLGELRSEYRLGAGSIRLDLTELNLAGQDVAVRVDVGAGEIRVVAPDDVEVVATGRSGIGQVRLFDVRAAGGIGAGEQQATHVPDGTPRGRLELDLQAGLGEVRVELAPPADRAAAPSADRAAAPSADRGAVPSGPEAPSGSGHPAEPDLPAEPELPAGSDPRGGGEPDVTTSGA